MTGAHRIDIAPFHSADIFFDLFFCNCAAAVTVELVAVDSPDHKPLSIQKKQPVPDLDPSEAKRLLSILACDAIVPLNEKLQFIQCRILRAPQRRVRHRERNAPGSCLKLRLF